jgi:hypothetical protein
LCVGNCIDFTARGAGPLQYFFEQRQGTPDMVARREFRYHAAILPVHRNLRMQGVRQQAALRVVERESGFVAGAFDAENEHDLWGWTGAAKSEKASLKV